MTNEINPFQAPQAVVDDLPPATTPARIFAVSGRLNRLRYIAYSTGLPLLTLAIAGLLVAGLSMLSPILGVIGTIVLAVAYIYILILQFTLAIQRCHDFNASGWLSLIVLIPFCALLFWFIPGTATENRFGAPNPPNSTLLTLGAMILPLVFIIGILAAIAIPAYQQYSQRAQAVKMQQAPLSAPAQR